MLLEKKNHRAEVPENLSIINKCPVNDESKYNGIKVGVIDELTIGDIEIDQDEKDLLYLQPKFSVLKCLDEEDI